MGRIFSEINILQNNQTVPELIGESMLWNPELSGINEFLNIYTTDEDGNTGHFCGADKLRPGSFMEWMFGYKPGSGFPGVANMIHWADANYVSGCPTVVRGKIVCPFLF